MPGKNYIVTINLDGVNPPNYILTPTADYVTFTVNPKPIDDDDLTDPDSAGNIPLFYEATGYHGQYDGKAHDAITNESISPVTIDAFTHNLVRCTDYTVEYRLFDSQTDTAYSSSIPQITDKGDYIVNVKLTGKGNYTGELVVNVPASIVDLYTITYHNVTSSELPTNAPTQFAPDATEPITLPTIPNRTDYAFGGWYVSPALTGTTITSIDPTPAANKHNWDLYAKWTYTGADSGKTFIYIELDSDGTEHNYTQYDPLDTTGLIVYAHYTDGTSRELVPGEYSIDPADGATLATIGDIPVTVTYTEDGVTDRAAYTVTVTDVGAQPPDSGESVPWELVYIELDTTNVKVPYNYGEPLDVDGLIVYGYFERGNGLGTDNTKYRPLTQGEYSINPSAGTALDFTGGTSETITVTYRRAGTVDQADPTINADWRGHTDTPTPKPAPTANYVVVAAGYSITYHYITADEYAKVPAAKRTFTAETPTIALPVIARTDYTMTWHTDPALASAAVSSIDPSRTDNQHNWDLYAKWNYTQGTFIYIELDSSDVPHNYEVGDPLDTDELVVTAYYTDGHSRVLEPGEYTITPKDGDTLGTPGDIPVKVTYTEDGVTDTGEYIVTVTAENAPTPSDSDPWELIYIELDTSAVKKTYAYGNALDVKNLKVYGYFEKGNGLPDGSNPNRIRRLLTPGEYTINPAAGSALNVSGQRPVVVTYKRADPPDSGVPTSGADWRGHSTNANLPAPTADYVVIVAGGSGGGGGGGGGGGNPTPTPTPTPIDIDDEGPPLTEFPFVEEHIAYVNGYPEGDFRPDGFITRAEVAMIIYRLSAEANKDRPMPSLFTDVDNWSWYSQAVAYLASRHVLQGYPEGTYRPDAAISRAELATILARFQEFAGTDSDNRYADIAGHWAESSIVSITIRGWVNGYPDGLFHPDAAITRAETVRMVNNMLNRRIDLEDIPEGVKVYTDLPVPPEPTHWAYADIVEASNYHDKFTRKPNNSEIWEWPVTEPVPAIR
ncbi:MAG: S-layer homology domain-containing protein [Oscillospiraceae bacterium]|nr:S-layer homology domain-containing protein [Oscillospiraceae bacterium]